MEASFRPAGRTIAIVGGGFTGAAAAVQLARTSPSPLDIRVIEPRPVLGAGVAYSGDDPDHRVNGPIDILMLFRDDPGHFRRWYEESGELSRDPEALAETGQLYCRRAAFGRYMDALVRDTARSNPSGSTISHLRQRAADIEVQDGALRISLEDGERFMADHAYLAIGHEKPAIPGPFRQFERDERFVSDPWRLGRLDALLPGEDVLILGTALTSADVAASLLRRQDGGRIVAISRRGLRPREQGVLPPAAERLARMAASPPHYVRRHSLPERALAILRNVRKDIAALAAQGKGWEQAFDDLRDAAPVLWRALPSRERKRALDRLRRLYDVHRFRIAPQVATILRRAERSGRLIFRNGQIVAVTRTPGGFDIACRTQDGGEETLRVGAVVNCTGPDARIVTSTSPLLRALLSRGLIRADELDVGIDVDARCRAIGASGNPSELVSVIGPLTRGHFGDLIAIPQINGQILRLLTE